MKIKISLQNKSTIPILSSRELFATVENISNCDTEVVTHY